MRSGTLFVLPLVLVLAAACDTASPVARTSPSPAAVQSWTANGTVAVYDGQSGSGHTVSVVGLSKPGQPETGKLLAQVTLASRSPMPVPACPPDASGCGAARHLPSASPIRKAGPPARQ
jgi:hypothetical protein